MAFVGCSPRSGNKVAVHLAWSMGPAHTGNVNDITDVTRVLLIQSSPFLPCMAAFDFGKHINGRKSTNRGRKCSPFPCSPCLATLVFLQALKHLNGNWYGRATGLQHPNCPGAFKSPNVQLSAHLNYIQMAEGRSQDQ